VKIVALLVLAGCTSSAAPRGTLAALRPACGEQETWDGRACKPTGAAAQQLDAATQALDKLKVDDAKAALDAAEHAGPLAHPQHVQFWEQRGIADAYVDDEPGATAAFDMLLALDPGHFLSYHLSPKATWLFEKVRERKDRVPPELDVSWPRGVRVGDPVPVDVEVLADPKQFLKRATLFVRTRGESRWRAADLSLSAKEQRVTLPPIDASKAVSLELYAKAYDQQGNEVLLWSDPARPREIALRYDPPTPWYKTWWGIGSFVVAGVAIASVTAYELTVAPPDKITASASGH